MNLSLSLYIYIYTYNYTYTYLCVYICVYACICLQAVAALLLPAGRLPEAESTATTPSPPCIIVYIVQSTLPLEPSASPGRRRDLDSCILHHIIVLLFLVVCLFCCLFIMFV